MSDTATAEQTLHYQHVAFLFCPTGNYCREDRCQSYFKFNLIPTMRAPLEECESAGMITSLGARVSLIDAPAEKLNETEFIARVQALQPNLFVIVTTFGSLELDLAWAKKLKELFTATEICLRGAPCYVQSQEILNRTPAVDFCIRGEYESIFKDLLLNGPQSARGVVFRRGREICSNPQPALEADLDFFPFPNRTIIKPELYTVRGKGRKQATIRVQRGCPYTCTYCLVHTVNGNQARHRSPASIVREVQSLVAEGINHFYFRADTFSLDRDWTLELCRQLTEQCPTARWVTTTRVERVDREVIAAMAKAGCYGISFGVDVASSKISKLVMKKADLERAENAMRLCDQFKIISLAYIMIGFIWDNASTVKEAEDFIYKIRPDLVTVHFAHPYPGTVYYQQVLDSSNHLKIVNTREAQSEPALETQALSSLFLKRAAQRILYRHYLRPRVISSVVRKVLL